MSTGKIIYLIILLCPILILVYHPKVRSGLLMSIGWFWKNDEIPQFVEGVPLISQLIGFFIGMMIQIFIGVFILIILLSLHFYLWSIL